MKLSDFFMLYPKVALGLSGGKDSAYLLKAGLDAGADIGAYFVSTPFQPAFEQRDAQKLADELHIPLHVIALDFSGYPEILQNSSERCYFCKKYIFSEIRKAAAADGYPVLIDGTNASDRSDDRPGMRALEELSVLSPLKECGMTAADVRRASRLLGLFTAGKPAYACLATRVPTGTPITAALLEKIERAENTLFALGFSDFRIRLIPNPNTAETASVTDTAKLELTETDFARLPELRATILSQLSVDFKNILLDLNMRSSQ